MITHLKFVGIPVRDQQAALEFYTRKLGFEIATDQPFDGQQRWIELRIGNSATRMVLFTPQGHEDRIGTFFNGSIACDDVEATGNCASAASSSFASPSRSHGEPRRSSRTRKAINSCCLRADSRKFCGLFLARAAKARACAENRDRRCILGPRVWST